MCGSFGSGLAGVDRCCMVSSGEVRRGQAGWVWLRLVGWAKVRQAAVGRGKAGMVLLG